MPARPLCSTAVPLARRPEGIRDERAGRGSRPVHRAAGSPPASPTPVRGRPAPAPRRTRSQHWPRVRCLGQQDGPERNRRRIAGGGFGRGARGRQSLAPGRDGATGRHRRHEAMLRRAASRDRNQPPQRAPMSVAQPDPGLQKRGFARAVWSDQCGRRPEPDVQIQADERDRPPPEAFTDSDRLDRDRAHAAAHFPRMRWSRNDWRACVKSAGRTCRRALFELSAGWSALDTDRAESIRMYAPPLVGRMPCHPLLTRWIDSNDQRQL
jgi:hypothetical protein